MLLRKLPLVLLLLATQAVAADNMSGKYVGQYQCSVINGLELQVDDRGGSLTALFTFKRLGSSQKLGAYRMRGRYSESNHTFDLEPVHWVGRWPPGYTMVGMHGVFDPRARRLTGRINSFNCSNFILAAEGTAPAPALHTMRRAASARPRVRTPQVPSYSANSGNSSLPGIPYYDAAMSDPPGTLRESQPIDDVIDLLRDRGYSCMDTSHVNWDATGTRGTAPDYVSVREVYVMECDGDCKGLHYVISTDGIVRKFGASLPAPTFEIKTPWFGGRRFDWKFYRAPGGTPPNIVIYRWMGAKFNNGPGCRAPKSK